jgi:hypothetical protein
MLLEQTVLPAASGAAESDGEQDDGEALRIPPRHALQHSKPRATPLSHTRASCSCSTYLLRNERANGGELVGVDILVLGAATAGLTRAQSVKTMLAGAPEGVRGRSSRGAGTLGADHSSVQFDQIPEFSVTYWPTCAIKPLTGHETGRCK